MRTGTTNPALAHTPSGDDLVIIYTGGTTGMPKGVMWRNDDLFVALWEVTSPGRPLQPPIDRISKPAYVTLPAPPFMHGTALFAALNTIAGAGTVVLVPGTGFDPEATLATIEREGVELLTIVGDAFARPLVRALERDPSRFDLAPLKVVSSSGATWSPQAKQALLHLLPDIMVIDMLGSSEGFMSRARARAGETVQPARFAVSERVRVLTDVGVDVVPGSGEVGVIAVRGRLPLGYLNDPAKTAATFRTIDGNRYAVAGDYASVDRDGTIVLMGRGSACINTGGEKVYPEEVEAALRDHCDVVDCAVVGVPDEHWGEIVVALVHASSPALHDEREVIDAMRGAVAGYKRPKRVFFVDGLGRSPAGKLDYHRLRRIAAERVAESISVSG